MEPEVRYARTSDGLNVAYNAMGTRLTLARAGDEAGLPLHLGLHAGDVIRTSRSKIAATTSSRA